MTYNTRRTGRQYAEEVLGGERVGLFSVAL